ncbi:hypothetical protein WDW37_16100 [Bdellovibrionota bacterium FG-1]
MKFKIPLFALTCFALTSVAAQAAVVDQFECQIDFKAVPPASDVHGQVTMSLARITMNPDDNYFKPPVDTEMTSANGGFSLSNGDHKIKIGGDLSYLHAYRKFPDGTIHAAQVRPCLGINIGIAGGMPSAIACSSGISDGQNPWDPLTDPTWTHVAVRDGVPDFAPGPLKSHTQVKNYETGEVFGEADMSCIFKGTLH